MGTVLLRNGRAFNLGGLAHNSPVDIGIDGDGRVVEAARGRMAARNAELGM